MRFTRALLTLLPLFFFACGGGEGDDLDLAATPTAAAPVTWTQDIQPLVQRSCIRCHYEGGLPTVELSDYASAAPFASLIAGYVAAEIMPPPSADASCRDYLGSAGRTLTQAERDLFVAWAEGGAPEGDASDAVDTTSARVGLTDADVTLKIAEPYKPSVDEKGDDYACFVLDALAEETYFINAMEVMPGTDALVHHALLIRDPNGDAYSTYGTGAFGCSDVRSSAGLARASSDWELIGTWAPGTDVLDLGEGRGLRIEAGEALVLQIHYYAATDAERALSDQSGIALRTQRSVDDEVYVAMPGPKGFVIPAGDADFTASASYTVPEGTTVDILGAFPHMHLLGKAYSERLIRADGGEECVVRSDDFDFHSQGLYVFNEPLRAYAGDVLTVSCTWDNSTANPDLYYNPPVDVVDGEGTSDEMCFVFTYLTVVND